MGGRSSSKQESSQTTINKTVNAALDNLENSTAVVNSGDNVDLTMTDHGAINAAGSIVIEALDTVDSNNQQVFEAVEGASQQAIQSVEKIALTAQTNGQQVVAETLSDIFKPFLLVLLIGVVLVVLAMIYRSAKRV